MKKLSCIVALMLALMLVIASVPAFAATNIPIDEAHFPDPVFRSYVAKYLDNGDGTLTQAERNKVTSISVASDYDEEEDEETQITSLKGIEYFSKLKKLSVEGMSGSADLSSNPALTHISIIWGSLTSLNVKKNKNLTELWLEYNDLTKLDVSKNTKLTSLWVRGNRLSSLNVKKNTKLKYLDVGGNKLKSLNVTKNTKLTYLDCGRNKLSKLDVKKNTRLNYLVCNNNNLSKLDLSKNKKLKGLAVSGNKKLKKLDIAKCKTLQNAIKKKKLQDYDLPEGAMCWGIFFEGEMIEGLAISPFTKVTAGKKTLYKAK